MNLNRLETAHFCCQNLGNHDLTKQLLIQCYHTLNADLAREVHRLSKNVAMVLKFNVTTNDLYGKTQ